MSSSPFSFMQLDNIALIEAMYAQYQQDPDSLEPTWRYFFEGMSFSAQGSLQQENLKSYVILDAYRRYGYLKAATNPLDTQPHETPEPLKSMLSDLDTKALVSSHGLLSQEQVPLGQLIQVLESYYCGSCSTQYMHCAPAIQKWIQQRVETLPAQLQADVKKRIFYKLRQAHSMETFLHTKYVGQKRFSLEGAEIVIPMLAELIEHGATLGIQQVVMGMAHRGRLNVLAHILNKSYSMIFSEFEDFFDPTWSGGHGDMKYHKGYSADLTTQRGHNVHVSLTANPSHLESVGSVVQGRAYAKQQLAQDLHRTKIVPVMLHGDAALAGQGIVYEIMQLSALEGYGTGGTLHLVIDNQVGFTATSKETRSSCYATDLALSFGAPVFHMNAEDTESCIRATMMALELRQTFHCDVFLNLMCYRRHGHSESDEPTFTQPQQHQIIGAHRSLCDIYQETLLSQGVLDFHILEEIKNACQLQLEGELQQAHEKKKRSEDQAFEGAWNSYHKVSTQELFSSPQTGVLEQKLRSLAQCFSKIPQNFTPHTKLERLIQERLKRLDTGVDWALAEELAFASLLAQQVPVRLSGQDCRRGTFSQRHAVWVDQKTSQNYLPLAHLQPQQGHFEVWNSPLSEFGVLGFEFGYSLDFPAALVLWEAQFGDFANGAQVLIDQYLAASEQKWQRSSGLVLLLPHGYEGQGAEHSSARLERYLQLCAQNNLQVCYPTTPVQYFHLLRRQVTWSMRLPLIVMTPKGFLRHPKCISPLSAFTQGSFQEILCEQNLDAHHLICCTGHIYYDLMEQRAKLGHQGSALICFEQLYPLQEQRVKEMFSSYAQVKKVSWIQEEPANMGAAPIFLSKLQQCCQHPIELISRPASATTATGSHAMHKKEFEELMRKVFV